MVNKKELVRGLPKAELHVHLFGTLTEEVYDKVVKRNEIQPAYDIFGLKFTDLPNFIKAYDAGVSVFKTEEDFGKTKELLEGVEVSDEEEMPEDFEL